MKQPAPGTSASSHDPRIWLIRLTGPPGWVGNSHHQVWTRKRACLIITEPTLPPFYIRHRNGHRRVRSNVLSCEDGLCWGNVVSYLLPTAHIRQSRQPVPRAPLGPVSLLLLFRELCRKYPGNPFRFLFGQFSWCQTWLVTGWPSGRNSPSSSTTSCLKQKRGTNI